MRKLIEQFFDWLDAKLHEETYEYWEDRCYRLENRVDELEEELMKRKEA